MTQPESVKYSSLAGARLLLEPFEGWGNSIPLDPTAWQEKLFPLIRGIKNAERDGGRTLSEIATELRIAADLFERFPDGGAAALQRIPSAAEASRTPQVLREIAEHIDDWRPGWSTWSAEPLSTGELLLRFPRFQQILPIFWGQDGVAISDDMQDATTEDGIRMFIEETHPYCPWKLPSVVAECYQAIALFHTEEEMDRFFSGEAMTGGSGTEDFLDFFPLFAQRCIEHLKEAHHPLWEPKVRWYRRETD
ncbi:hypothetical protein L0F81_19355 [Streptomyces tricolor]|uniref:Uncharacterized protein n=1 Tax=Streptomyces tricolor TaxID=68277 RepID=A0ABS9JIR5_9ACTN|nr:hypothetical protein [Streptomyces tricolor]MCG0065423.1 hypothetical protein [Streptomyces tricolor]